MSTPDPLAQGGHSDAMDIDQPKKRDADSLFVHEDEEDEAGHNSKRQKQNFDSAYASQSQGGTPEQNHDSAPQSPPKTPSRKHKSTIIIVDGKVPGLKQWLGDRRPCLAVYHPSFKQSEKEATQACNRFIDQHAFLKDKGYCNAEVDHIVHSRLPKFRFPASSYPVPKPVVLLGAAGAGKSSGLNCYLDKTAVAVESDSGARGTKTVHEYSTACHDQNSKYRVVARYAPLKQVQLEVEKHCSAVVNWRQREKGQFDAEEEDDMKKQHDTAMDFFNTLLGDREDFDVDLEDTDYFEDNSGEDVPDLADELCGYILELLESKGVVGNDMTQSLEAEDEEELNRIFTALSGPAGMNDISRGKVSTWPLISKIEIHLSNNVLDDGVKIADAPGVTDTNHTVVQKTKDYLKEAGTIFVFTTPTRVKNNPDLDKNLTECIHLGKMQSTYLIVTNIDGKTSFKQTDLANLRAEDRAQYQDAEDRLHNLKHEHIRLMEAKKSESDFDEYKALEARGDEVALEIKQAEMKIQQVAVEIRNRSIELMVKNKFRELEGSKNAPDLKVIFTSNSEYQKHLTGYDENSLPILDREATGIPKVQDVLYRVPAIGKTHTLGRFIDVHLPGVFNGIIGTLTKSSLERKSEVATLIRNHFDEVEAIVGRILAELNSSYQDHIRGAFLANHAKWVAAIQAKLEGWSTYKAATFTAFCRRKGVWKALKDEPFSNWNYEIQEVYRAKLNGGFNLVDADLDATESGLINSINTLFQDLERKLEACEGLQGVNPKPLFRQFRVIRDGLIDDVTEHFQILLKDKAREIRNSATLRSEYTCITDIMDSTYTKCAELKAADVPPADPMPSKSASKTAPAPAKTAPTPLKSTGKTGTAKPKKKKGGVHAVRVEELRKKLVGDGGVTGVYDTLGKELRTCFTALIKNYEEKLKDDLASASEKVLEDFDLRYQTAAPTTEEDAEAVEMLKNEAQIALESIERAKALYEEAMAYETENAASA
ncbi:hypothetical protein BDY17DRAFT_328139 [Neohortaea acidophila]|uniref:DUF7605 domain-containing protein n=1 Tax=Neohortaea acidophila TaxID=245834 RepID=A0A6A6PFV0_9PEZI|nr:uncharacterized protein BDY17DRAFT_328139 [Neohortaea acidophila]KAF2478604.1 hypothetical protein BDY17DRAFT_328139 [Neohortaea acidophila]